MTHLPGLDLLRAIPIVWVMLFHSFLVGGLGPDFAWLSRYGWAGVDIFFVLSGFLIGTQVLQILQRTGRISLAGFYARRAWRILPAFAVMLALYVFFPSLRELPGLQPGWQFATFTMNLLIDYERNPAFSHAWSLCVEEHFYLVFPLLALGLSRRARTPQVIALGLALVLLGIVLRGATSQCQRSRCVSLAIGPAPGSAAHTRAIAFKCASTSDTSRPGHNAVHRCLSKISPTSRKSRFKQYSRTPTLSCSPRSTRGTSRTMA